MAGTSFWCLGPNAKKHEFHSKSIVQSHLHEGVHNPDEKTICLFGCTYTFPDELLLSMEEVFCNCRKYLWLLLTKLSENRPSVNFIKLRNEITRFLNYLCTFLNVTWCFFMRTYLDTGTCCNWPKMTHKIWLNGKFATEATVSLQKIFKEKNYKNLAHPDITTYIGRKKELGPSGYHNFDGPKELGVFYTECFGSTNQCSLGESFLDDLEEQLWHLRLLFQKFTFTLFPNFALAAYPSSRGNECQDALYNIVHCHLDARWFFINIIQELQCRKEQHLSGTQFSSSHFKLVVEEEVIRLICELMSLAIVRYENTDKTELIKTEISYCSCFKELWILLMHFPYRKEDFWTYLNQCLRMFLENTTFHGSSDELSLSPQQFPSCSNRREFLIWFCAGLAQLQYYDRQGNYVANTTHENLATLEIIDDVVRTVLLEGDGPCEGTMRLLMPMLHRIHRVWGHTMCGSLVHLWDQYFHGRINSAFYIAGSNLNSTIVVSKSGQALLEQVKKRLDISRRDKSENSFFLFLSLLGEYLTSTRRHGNSVKRFCGRVFVKFCGKTQKLEELSDIGVYHLASLFLTLAVGTSDQSIVLNLLRTLTGIPTSGIREGKHGMIWKGIAACVLALQEMQGDVAGAAEVILGHLTPAAPVGHLLDALRVMFECEPISIKGLHLFIDNWMAERELVCSDTNGQQLMSIFVALLRNIKEPLRAGNKEAQTLLTKSEEIIRPILTNRLSRICAEVAAMFTVLSNRRMDLYQYWSEHRECDMAGVYLACLLDQGADVVAAHLPQAPSKAVQVWVRGMFGYGPTEENKRFYRILTRLPQNQMVFQGWVHEDPFLNFLHSYSSSNTILIAQTLRQTFLSHFKGFDTWLEKHTNHLDQLPGQHLERLYHYTTALIMNCPQFIYARCDASSLIAPLVDCVLLPRRIYDPGYCAPRSLTQAMAIYLPSFLQGLMQLVPDSDPYVWRVFKDTITHYIGRYDHLPAGNHPLAQFLQSSVTIPLFAKVFRVFFEVKDGKPHRNYTHALRLLQFTAVEIEEDVSVSLFDNTGQPIIEALVLLDDRQPIRVKTFDYLAELLQIKCNREKIVPILMESCKKYLAFNASAWFRMAAKIVPLGRSELQELPALVESEVLAVEKKRGVERDKALRCHLDSLKRLLIPAACR